ncbi:hypothetical protein MKX03_008625, partial [Papaver bracteatum]
IEHQWYQTYEYSDYNSLDEQSLTFDSYMIPEDDSELGVKCDVVPGRSNQTSILVQREGVYYGQCSEILPRKEYGSWVSNLLIGAPDEKAPLNWFLKHFVTTFH